MANILTAGAWFSAPTRKASFLTRLLRVQIQARQQRADRVVERYLAARGLELPDDAERQTGRLLVKAGRQP